MNNQKKSILLVMTTMNTGGIATSVKNLINALPEEKYAIDLLLFNKENSKAISISGDILSAGKYMRLLAISQKQALNENKVFGCYRAILGVITKIWGHKYVYAMLLKHTPRITKIYDIAISCSQSGPLNSLYGGCNEFVLSKVTSKLKIAYIHCDYKTYGLDSKYSHRIYQKFDKIACVSESVRNCFLQCEPTLENKTYVSTNFNNYEQIRALSFINTVEYNKCFFHFATVARMGKEKGHIRMLPIISHLKKKGYKFIWHIIGGDLKTAPKEISTMIKKYQIEDCIEFHGDQSNPYRFIKNINLLLIPSYHEAAPMVYAEANYLGIPILTTNTLSAKELVEIPKIGIVCDNNDKSIEETLEKILKNPSILNNYVNNVTKDSNKKAYTEFEKLIKNTE